MSFETAKTKISVKIHKNVSSKIIKCVFSKIHKVGTTNFLKFPKSRKRLRPKNFYPQCRNNWLWKFILILFFRGNSLKRTVPKPTIKVSVPRPDSLSLELYDDDNKKDEENIEIIKKVPSAVLPDEITEELDALSRDDFMPSWF